MESALTLWQCGSMLSPCRHLEILVHMSIITALFFRELEETTRTSSYYMDEDYPAKPEV